MRTAAGVGHRLDVATDRSRAWRPPRASGNWRMRLELIDLFCARFERVPRCIVLDIDDTDDAVHGQQLALFNTYAGDYCFQPIKIFEATTGRPVLSLLRPGRRPSGEEVEQILRHVIGRIHRNWPAVEIMVRGDSHFATPGTCWNRIAAATSSGCPPMRLTEIGRPWGEDVATRRALSTRIHRIAC